jgi:hypothetical protein
LFDVQSDPGQTQPLDDPAIEIKMITLLIREMARNECPSEQYERLGLPAPARLGEGHQDEMIKMPREEEIREACLLRATGTVASGEQAGEGFPKMPFQTISWEAEKPISGASFPDNLRLRPGYFFSQSKVPPTKT